jgi:undecaprenyl-diphosphatase
MNDTAYAILLGIVEGVTEFLPVSSTGHLILVDALSGYTAAHAKTFEVFIQLGAILAVVFLYHHRFRAFLSLQHNTGLSGFSGIRKVAIACAPAFILGALLHGAIKLYLFSTATVAVGFIVGALLFIFVEKRTHTVTAHTVDELTDKQAFLIGIFQCLALWPGMSRSGSTILGGLLVGCERKVAAEFSFLVAVPVMCAAVAFDLYKSGSMLTMQDAPLFATGFITAFLSALCAVKLFVGFVSRFTLVPFAVYRIVLGVLILVLL